MEEEAERSYEPEVGKDYFETMSSEQDKADVLMNSVIAVGPRDQTPVTWLDKKCLYLQSQPLVQL